MTVFVLQLEVFQWIPETQFNLFICSLHLHLVTTVPLRPHYSDYLTTTDHKVRVDPRRPPHDSGHKIPAHRSLFVLEHLIGFFKTAALLDTLPFDVPLSQLLHVAIGSRESFQEGVSILKSQECCNTGMNSSITWTHTHKTPL